MKIWTVCLLFVGVLLTGCSGNNLPPATETPKPDEAAIKKGMEESMKRGGYGRGRR